MCLPGDLPTIELLDESEAENQGTMPGQNALSLRLSFCVPFQNSSHRQVLFFDDAAQPAAHHADTWRPPDLAKFNDKLLPLEVIRKRS
jgi:hypothetical protein